ncbi:YfhE family protein [Sporosarcina jiandibaonis]|uniref:YfhE family protein n=1 Tax=Sporosarcina jiandibaonis TaxID=2715535 RepID=UPI003CCDCC1A
MKSEKKAPHERMTEKNNGLSSTQEVTYQREFKKADNAVKNEKKAQNQNPQS